jgi:hypothetical protein
MAEFQFRDLNEVLTEWGELERKYDEYVLEQSKFRLPNSRVLWNAPDRPGHTIWGDRHKILPHLRKGVRMYTDEDVLIVDPEGMDPLDLAVMVTNLHPDECTKFEYKGTTCLRLWWD